MQTIHTIGTQSMNDEKFIVLLAAHQIDAVIDVRLHNEGWRYRFASGRHLKALVESHGIAYLHDRRFAPTREMLVSFREGQDWPAYEQAYQRLIFEQGMISIWQEVAKPFLRPCLLCAEKIPVQCHRRLLAERISQEFGVPIVHLGRKQVT